MDKTVPHPPKPRRFSGAGVGLFDSPEKGDDGESHTSPSAGVAFGKYKKTAQGASFSRSGVHSPSAFVPQMLKVRLRTLHSRARVRAWRTKTSQFQLRQPIQGSLLIRSTFLVRPRRRLLPCFKTDVPSTHALPANKSRTACPGSRRNRLLLPVGEDTWTAYGTIAKK